MEEHLRFGQQRHIPEDGTATDAQAHSKIVGTESTVVADSPNQFQQSNDAIL
jgi:hypothetical protein